MTYLVPMGLEALYIWCPQTMKGCASSILPGSLIAADSGGLTSMEPAAPWGPCQMQLANWTGEEPTVGLPVEYASIDIPEGTCALEYDVQQLLVEYYSGASQQNAISEKPKISNDSRASTSSVVKQVVEEFKVEMDMMKKRMHRYPACLGAVDNSYTMPRIVAIGPYHHGLEHLKKAEKVKHAAACRCIGEEGKILEELYDAIVPVADRARPLYDKDVMVGMSDDDFRHMMFFDACFLVQYMLFLGSRHYKDKSLWGFFNPNVMDIFHDVMLLENQLPWKVVEVVMSFIPVSSISKKFVHRMRRFMLSDDLHDPPEQKPFVWYDNYRPPHLLGLLRYYSVGKSNIEHTESEKTMNIAFSVSAMELAEIGITLAPNKTMELIDMHLNQKGTLFAELSLAPLSLDRDCASYLVNMAAFELCTVKSFTASPVEDSAVCSYLLLLSNLVYREEDVHELRERDLLQGGGGLTNEEALRFFTSIQVLRRGPCYMHIMRQIGSYRNSSKTKTKLLAFFHNHKKTIAAFVTGIGAVGGIIGTLLSIKKSV